MTILLHLTNTFAELLYCFCILLIKGCSIETGVQSPHWMLCEKRIIPAQYHLSTVVVEMAKENRWSDALATKANAGKGGKQSRNVTNIKCICLNFLMYKAKQASGRRDSKKCDKTKKCSQVRWKWYKNYALCTPHDYCSFHLKVNRLTHVTWRHIFSYFSLLCLTSK